MIKRVKTKDLRVGMYIHDLNVPWLDHGFSNSRFLIQDEKQIQKVIQANISEVSIDTVRGIDAVHAPTLEEAESALMEKILGIASEPSLDPLSLKFDSQWAESQQTHLEAVEVVGNILQDARLGKQVNVQQANPVVEQITNAVMGNDGTLLSLCRIKQRDVYTFQHSVSISALLVAFGHSLGVFSRSNLLEIGLGGMFHDIGKTKIPDEILNKPGRLTDAEFAIMRTHVDEGVNCLRRNGGISESALKIVAEHHERFDGSGYPRGISRNAISLLGQMTSIVDVYDAITSIRVYHSALEPSEALKRMFEWSGKHFDETLVQKFIKAIGIYPVGSLVRLESGRLAVVLRQNEHNMLQPLVRVIYSASRGHKLSPQNLNLAAPTNQDTIVGYEIPGNWGIDPMKYLEKVGY
jgi:putative nucleotidyltransferase with HDIG domain